ncbi:FAD-binding oxidoreductase [soil metagenome]
MSIEQITGTVLRPGDGAYAEAASVYAGTGTPTLIVRPRSAQDVAHAIGYARAESLVVSIRSGGHSGLAHSTNDGGLVIDLRDLSVIAVDGTRVSIGGGATWGAIAAALRDHGLALSSGDTLSVGVGGLTLGGGFGWLVRQYGLAIDSLVGAEVVTAAGEILDASETDSPELFWAIRGGGGNFGVVTRFDFEAHPLEGVVFGTITYPADDLEPVLRRWRNVMREAPEALNSTFLALPSFGPDVPPSAQVLVCFSGTDEAAALAVYEPLLVGSTSHDILARPYTEVLDEAHPPEGVLFENNNALARVLDDDTIAGLVRGYSAIGSGVLMIRSLGGAFGRVGSDATAFAHRDAEALVITAGFIPPEEEGQGRARFRRAWDGEFAPHLHGAYGNFLGTDDVATVERICLPATLQRLRSVKAQYDPENVFARNQNVPPGE